MAEQAAGQGRQRTRSRMSESTSGDKATSSAGELEDVLALVEAHARHAATQLPRGQLGTQAAEAFLAAIAGAVRLRLADVTGTATAIVEMFVAHGLLPVLPNPKVSRAIPRLLAPLTPLVEARSARLWTLWLTALQDPRSPLVVNLRKATPAAALAVRPPAPTARVRTLRQLTVERDALAVQVANLQAERAELAAQLVARAEEQRQTAAERDVLAQQLATMQAERVPAAVQSNIQPAEHEWHAPAQGELAELREQLQRAEAARAAAEAEAQALTARLAQIQLEDPQAAASSELERVAEFYEAQLREVEARVIDAERHARAAAEFAELQAFLQRSAPGQEQLRLFALQRPPK